MKRIVLMGAVMAWVSSVASASWTQGFVESGVGSFNLVAVRMTSAGDSFETPTHSGFNAAGWALLFENDPTLPTIASASGPDVTNMTWTIQFAGSSSNPLTFDFVAFHDDTIVESAMANWSGSGWSFGAGTWQPTVAELSPPAVPAPGALLLGGLGTLIVNRIRRRSSV